jgi:polar amino acid transport system substrate-binding protein
MPVSGKEFMATFLSTLAKILMLSLCLCFSGIRAETFVFTASENSPPFSYRINQSVAGITPEIIKLIFSFLPNDQVEFGLYSWARAQALVENGQADGLMTYPSKSRQHYADFSSMPANTMDFGYLIFHKKNPHRVQIEQAKSFDDLSSLTVLTQTGVGWEQDNIPKTLKRIEENSLETMIHLLLYRMQGDFIIMPVEQANYYAQQFGYQKNLAYQHVSFIHDSVIPFHIGIRKNHPQGKRLLRDIESILTSHAFITEKQKILDHYLKLPE